MISPDERPSLWDSRSSLISSLDLAEEFAHARPVYAEAVANLCNQVRRIKSNLMTSLEETPASSNEVLHGLSVAWEIALFLAALQPENSGPLTRFAQDLKQAQKEFRRKLRKKASPQT